MRPIDAGHWVRCWGMPVKRGPRRQDLKHSIAAHDGNRGNLSFADRIACLNKTRQEIIRPVQEHPRDFVLMSIRVMAQRLQTDPATVLRIARGMGFHSYPQFKAYLHELSIASATSLEGMQTSSPNESSLASHGRRALERDLHNLHSLRNTLDMNRVAAVAERVYEARRIVLLGGDMAIGLVDFLDYKLNLLGLPVVSATTPGKTIHITRSLGNHDLVIALSFRRCLRQTVEGIQQAKTNGAYTVGVTDTFVSPVARYADECFLTSVEAPFSNSYAAPMSFIHVLFTICAHYRRSRTVALLKKADQEQRQGYRWYPV
jgi:RpiR family carbohydrate utilization transcriptional regulator